MAAAACSTAAAPDEEEEEAWAWSWGAGTDGQLGIGGFQDHHLPQPLRLPPSCRRRVSYVAGGGAHAIALTGDGGVFTWGRGTNGQLGHGNVENCPQPKFIKFFESNTVTCVSAGWNHSGFVTDNEQLFMCGDGSFGQLGIGDCQSRSSPVEVKFFTTKLVKKLACGMRHSLALLNESGQLYIWGRGFSGNSDDHQPRPVTSSLRISQVALGWHHALVLAGEAYTIGAYRHQKLNGSESVNPVEQQSNPTTSSIIYDETSSLSTLEKVPCIGGERMVQISAGAEHSALVTDKGSILTWGWGEHGQLGLGDTSDQAFPRKVNIGSKRSSASASVSLRVYCGSGFTIAVDTS